MGKNNMQKFVFNILPKYAWIPIAMSLLINMITYFGSRIFTTNLHHRDLSIWIDKQLPFVAPMMIIYVLAYVHWIVGFVVIGRESREVCYEVMPAEQIAKLSCLLCFILLPATLTRPEVIGNGFSEWLTRLIYAADRPDNLFPSIHCLDSWICFRGVLKCKKVGTGFKTAMGIMAVLVFASTLLVKQHVFVDVVAGIAVVEMGLFLSKRFKLSRIYYTIEKKLFRDK